MKVLFAVALGGALGALGRHAVASTFGHWFGTAFPFSTLAVNIAGSFVLGLVVELGALAWTPSPELRSFLVVGVLGAFTTFSTFSLDVMVLYERGAPVSAAAYIVLSVALSVAGLIAGLQTVRWCLG